MFELLNDVLWFVDAVWQVTIRALRFDPLLLRAAEAYPRSSYIIATVAILAGASQLLGQSVTLFVNRVTPGRFVASLLLNGVMFALSLIIWATTIWLVAGWLFDAHRPLTVVMRMVALGSAPYMFGFFILIPYLGTFLARLFSVWSFLIVLAVVQFTLQIGILAALVCTGVGWLLVLALSQTIGRPLIALRNLIWRRVLGSPLEANVKDILGAFVELYPEYATGTRKKGDGA